MHAPYLATMLLRHEDHALLDFFGSTAQKASAEASSSKVYIHAAAASFKLKFLGSQLEALVGQLTYQVKSRRKASI